MSPIDAARKWIAGDPDPVTAAELQRVVDANDVAELAERMSGPLEFGTAGLRGILGAGEARLNRAVVRRTTDGLARYLLATDPTARKRGVVVGYDCRRMSREFAEDAASVLAAHGIVAHLFTELGPTPLCAFGVLDRKAAAGIMITASHNPAEYNGYKAYAADGGQIVPPVDRGIAAAIALAPAANAVPFLALGEAQAAGLVIDLPHSVGERWLQQIQAESRDRRGRSLVRVVYTPIHGTGDKWTREILDRFGFQQVWSVPEQQAPDGEFPTAPFPNPEEKGVMDLALALADRVGANLVLANDPDSDRLAVAIPERSGGFRSLSGNEVGWLLGEYLLKKGPGGPERVVMNSIVSSPALGVIAERLGVQFAEVLTGFKWIAAMARKMETKGAKFVFGYEEALGYTIGTIVRDKDGVGAAALFAELAAVALSEGHTVQDELDRLARTYGLFVSGQHNVTRKGTAGLAEIAATMDRLRASRPEKIGDHAVLAVRDLGVGVRYGANGETAIDLPRSNVLVYDLDGGARVIARPSGTEPKIKFYFDLREDVRDGEGLEAARGRAEARIARLTAAFVALAG